MNASDIFNYCVPFINALSPVILVIAIVANARLLMDFIVSIFGRMHEGDF